MDKPLPGILRGLVIDGQTKAAITRALNNRSARCHLLRDFHLADEHSKQYKKLIEAAYVLSNSEIHTKILADIYIARSVFSGTLARHAKAKVPEEASKEITAYLRELIGMGFVMAIMAKPGRPYSYVLTQDARQAMTMYLTQGPQALQECNTWLVEEACEQDT